MVTGRFVTRRVGETVRITLIDGTVLESTPVHPVWSIDREDFIAMSALQPGERLQTATGLLAIATVQTRHVPVPVYNIEVRGQHVYEVSDAGILVHNAKTCVFMGGDEYNPGWDRIFGKGKQSSVTELDSGAYGRLVRNSVGDGLTPDHMPSFAAIKASREGALGRKQSVAEARKLRDEMNALMVKTDLHQQFSRTYGGRNTVTQIAQDAADLQKAFLRDVVAWRAKLIAAGHHPDSVDKALDVLNQRTRLRGFIRKWAKMRFDPTQMLGKPIVAMVRDVLPSVFETPPDNEIIEDCIYSTFRHEGFGLIADLSGEVVSVQLYSGGFDGLDEYRKLTPGNISFPDDHEVVRAKLGSPSVSTKAERDPGVAWDRFDFERFSIHVQYNGAGKSVGLITIRKK